MGPDDGNAHSKEHYKKIANALLSAKNQGETTNWKASVQICLPGGGIQQSYDWKLATDHLNMMANLNGGATEEVEDKICGGNTKLGTELLWWKGTKFDKTWIAGVWRRRS